ncbi:hypothetical protein IV203_001940 [Nitzschia inconspicua]|uniref:Uncharacterized protein n=1 Tax=Nitzschia inconspicua TaxID=303405 RepID=A0A9K3PRT0_9STRA|nr:hypothetical protein IV203_001940 [Nitzschia inconspicua]
MYPIPFADDPVRGSTISLATGDVKGLDPGQWLSTSLVDYVLQTSLAGKLPDHVLIGSSNCSTYFHTYNSKLRNEDDTHCVRQMRDELQPYAESRQEDAQLAGCGPRSLEVAHVATERNTDAGPGMEFGPTKEPGQEQDPILDYEDNYFQENFSSKGMVFGTVDDVLVAINEYQELSENALSTVRTRGNARTFVCISHANCPFSVKFGPMPKQEGIFYKPENCTIRHRGAKVVSCKSGKRFKKRCKELVRGIVSDVAAHKYGPPTAMDVMKAGVHKKKTHLQYYQCYRGVREWKARKEITDPMSFELLGPYIERFREQNQG